MSERLWQFSTVMLEAIMDLPISWVLTILGIMGAIFGLVVGGLIFVAGRFAE